jgi:hypothetical protein
MDTEETTNQRLQLARLLLSGDEANIAVGLAVNEGLGLVPELSQAATTLPNGNGAYRIHRRILAGLCRDNATGGIRLPEGTDAETAWKSVVLVMKVLGVRIEKIVKEHKPVVRDLFDSEDMATWNPDLQPLCDREYWYPRVATDWGDPPEPDENDETPPW